MTTTNLMPQALEQQSAANGKVYFPFQQTDEVLVNGVQFDNQTEYKIRVVEDYNNPISNGDQSKSIDLGFVKTNCLVVETIEEVKVKVLILKKQ